jgi:hypothetical protein
MIYDFIDNRLSPTLVRDIRQLVRNRFIIVMLNLYLLILTLGTLMTITMQSARTRLEGTGGELYAFDLIFFFIFTFIVVNLYTAVIMSQERITNDLMFTTTIPPSGFVFGKLSSALVLAGMLFCVTLPFITIAYMLRGIDLQTILQTCFLVILTLGLSLSMTILVFSRVKTYVMMIGLMILYAILCSVGISSFFGILLFYMRTFGGAMVFGIGPDWWQLLLIGVLTILTTLVILAGATSRVASTNTNRIMPFRITYTVYMLLTLGGAFIITIYFGTGSYLIAGGYAPLDTLPVFMVCFHYAFFLVLIVISTCGRDTWGLRIKRMIPKNLLLRCLVFPFYSGAINGIIWLIGIAGVLLCGLLGAAAMVKSGTIVDPDSVREAILYGSTWAIMTYAFCTLAMMIRIKFLKRHLAPEHTWLLALALFGGFYAIYFTIRILLADDRAYHEFYLESDTIERTLLIAIAWAVLASILFVPWALRQLPKFAPNEEEQGTVQKSVDVSEP